ncbi:hypothetical protein [Micropruina sp.]
MNEMDTTQPRYLAAWPLIWKMRELVVETMGNQEVFELVAGSSVAQQTGR